MPFIYKNSYGGRGYIKPPPTPITSVCAIEVKSTQAENWKTKQNGLFA